MVKLARRYLAHRRGFGYRLRTEGHDLLAFARFLHRTAPGQPLTTKLALQWIKLKPAQPVTVAHRLSAIRGFARFCATLDPRTQIPPNHLTHYRNSRRAPHIFTDAQLQLILRRIKDLRPWRTELRPLTYRTLIGLLVCSGLRPSEALRLRDQDFDATTGTLRVPAVKAKSETHVASAPFNRAGPSTLSAHSPVSLPVCQPFFCWAVRPALADLRCRLDLSTLGARDCQQWRTLWSASL
jgi:integrase